MYDVTDAKSFRAIPKWLKDCREKAEEHVQILLIRKFIHLQPTNATSQTRNQGREKFQTSRPKNLLKRTICFMQARPVQCRTSTFIRVFPNWLSE